MVYPPIIFQTEPCYNEKNKEEAIMPALYAHYRFGARVSRRLDGDLKDIVKKYHAQFVIGLQGPDLFFFYRPWSLNRVSKYGYRLHSLSAAPFFEHGISDQGHWGRQEKVRLAPGGKDAFYQLPGRKIGAGPVKIKRP